MAAILTESTKVAKQLISAHLENDLRGAARNVSIGTGEDGASLNTNIGIEGHCSMSDYANKLSSISERKQKLELEETRLIEKRKEEIGRLAEQFGLLTASDALIIGLFTEARTAIHSKSEKIKSWEQGGANSQKSKRHSKSVVESPA